MMKVVMASWIFFYFSHVVNSLLQHYFSLQKATCGNLYWIKIQDDR